MKNKSSDAVISPTALRKKFENRQATADKDMELQQLRKKILNREGSLQSILR